MKIIKEAENKYSVESTHNPGKFYSVDPKKPFCTCPQFRFRGLKMHSCCKHIDAVRQSLGKKRESKDEKIVQYVQEKGAVNAVELIELFGEETVDELIRLGYLYEKNGTIHVLR